MKTFGKSHTLMNEIHWRDFFTHIAFHFPRILAKRFIQSMRALPGVTMKIIFALGAKDALVFHWSMLACAN
jgi:hypothetical protein